MKSACIVVVVCFMLVPVGVNAGEWIIDSKTNCKVWNPNPVPNETISWSGKCVSSYASGKGTLIWYKNGDKNGSYEGEMKNGKPHGKGINTDSKGNRYEGDFVDGKPHGKGINTNSKGNRYEGDFVDGKPHGKGIHTDSKGNRYEGDFVDGKPHGKGIHTSADGGKIMTPAYIENNLASRGGPTGEEIHKAIQRSLGSEVPVSWVGNLMGGRNAVLNSTEVVRVGIYNKEKKYWPLKVRVQGSCKLNDPFNQKKTASFNKIADFAFFRDDYGDWQAVLLGGMFQ